MGKAAFEVLTDCNFVVFIVVVAVHLLVFYNLPLRMYQKNSKVGTPVAINYRENKCHA